MMRRLMCVSLGLLMTWAIAPVEAIDRETAGRVTGEHVNIRAGSNRNFEILTQVERDDWLLVTGEQGDWYSILLPPDTACYVAANYVRQTAGVQGHSSGDRVNVRGGPDTRFNILSRLAAGEHITLLSHEGEWFRILPPADAQGWIAKPYVQLDDTMDIATVRAAYSTRAQQLASTTVLPVTGAGQSQPSDLGPPRAQGRLVRSRAFWHRPATHKILQGDTHVAYLTSDTISLNTYLNTPVAVWGRVLRHFGQTPLIMVSHIEPQPSSSAATE